MKKSCVDGYLEQLRSSAGYKTDEILTSGRPGVVIECTENIPCNPCEAVCPFEAIRVGNPITNLPSVDLTHCTGCGLCIPACPGQAIFVLNPDCGNGNVEISFAYEFLPLPEKGQKIKATDRDGNYVCDGLVVRVNNAPKNDATAIVTISVPKEFYEIVRGMVRL
jgi:Fe-S-cluster-containing hydrogenase component 2